MGDLRWATVEELAGVREDWTNLVLHPIMVSLRSLPSIAERVVLRLAGDDTVTRPIEAVRMGVSSTVGLRWDAGDFAALGAAPGLPKLRELSFDPQYYSRDRLGPTAAFEPLWAGSLGCRLEVFGTVADSLQGSSVQGWWQALERHTDAFKGRLDVRSEYQFEIISFRPTNVGVGRDCTSSVKRKRHRPSGVGPLIDFFKDFPPDAFTHIKIVGALKHGRRLERALRRQKRLEVLDLPQMKGNTRNDEE